MEQIIAFLQQLDARNILVALAFAAFAKHLLPPLPSDALLVFGGALAALGTLRFDATLAACAASSVAGFMVVFAVGRLYKQKTLRSSWSRFIPTQYLQALERLFTRYGYGVVAINRFLGVKRIAVSFFAGANGLAPWKTAFYASVSAVAWSACLMYAGYLLGAGWNIFLRYLSAYSWIAFVVVLCFVVWLLQSARKRQDDARVKK